MSELYEHAIQLLKSEHDKALKRIAELERDNANLIRRNLSDACEAAPLLRKRIGELESEIAEYVNDAQRDYELSKPQGG